MTEQEFEESEKLRVASEAKKRQIQEGGAVPGSTAEKLERIKSLRENAGFFAEGSALTTIQKILYMQEENVRLKEALNEFAEDQTGVQNKLDALQQAINSLFEATKETNSLLESEFKARDSARARTKELEELLTGYLKNWV